ncbi:hypothetical protein QBC47DRAFT_460087 [Echria macrotheca]|uniref:Nucleoporin NUP82 n=1 Tax=Echria macrotheca TaxID=438768 RepID=A0AAJ0BI21_9PEZI|nr:hypothetical protein QBC47DRAFT_460087 [Echria macrotheca]
MPRIKSFAPAWLNEPAPGHKLFEQPVGDSNYTGPLGYSKKPKPGPRRTIAHRGTEVFVAVGKQIRWGDLARLKETWESSRHGSGIRAPTQDSIASFEVYDEEAAAGNTGGPGEGYRILKTPVAEDIRQLVMSPQQDYLAVLTSHTVHICILPDSSHLHANDTAPFKPKFWTLGPTTHVTSRSAVVSALWHPLGVNGSALVTVTEDAVVRVWELSTADRWSFDSPTLAVDLKKLADGTSLDQDFGVSTSAANKVFSPDDADMEVAAACFPGRGSGGWSAMTLWIAMVGGDVYALCPLLPQRWSPPPTLIPSLSVSVVAKVASTEDDPAVSAEAKLLAQQQLEWMSDLDSQEPKLVEVPFSDYPAEVYTRPSRPGIIPRLQGPFELDVNATDEQEDEVELKDIFVIGESINTSDLMFGEDEDIESGEPDGEGLSLTVVCLLSTSGQVKICLDVNGVEAQWLPPRHKARGRQFSVPTEPPSLLAFQTFDTVKPAELTPDSWPMFSEDITSRYAFYVTHPAGITYISLVPWVFRLEGELKSDSGPGADFRIALLAQGKGSERERLYTQPLGQSILAAATAIRDPDLGHFVLSATLHDPVALFFETPERDATPSRPESPQLIEQREASQPPVVWEPRPLFHPSDALDNRSAVPTWLDHIKTGRRRPVLQQEVRLSVATLEVFTEGHRVVSTEVFELNNAVAELFRKCEALHAELHSQIDKVNEVKQRIDTISGNESGDDEPVSEDMLIKDRLRIAKDRQLELTKRMEGLRKKFTRATSRELSDKEKAWVEEVRSLEESVLGTDDGRQQHAVSPRQQQPAWKRFDEIKSLRDALLSQVEQLQKAGGAEGEGGGGSPAPASPARGGMIRIPADIRKAKVAQIMGLLDRESALVDAVKTRLERLSIG